MTVRADSVTSASRYTLSVSVSRGGQSASADAVVVVANVVAPVQQEQQQQMQNTQVQEMMQQEQMQMQEMMQQEQMQMQEMMMQEMQMQEMMQEMMQQEMMQQEQENAPVQNIRPPPPNSDCSSGWYWDGSEWVCDDFDGGGPVA